MNKALLKKITAQAVRIQKTKEQIAKLRDRLREEISDLEGIIDSVTQGVESLEFGLQELNSGVDTISELL